MHARGMRAHFNWSLAQIFDDRGATVREGGPSLIQLPYSLV